MRGQYPEIVAVQAQLQLAGIAADGLQRLAHQVGEQGGIDPVGAAEQAAAAAMLEREGVSADKFEA